MLEGNGMSTRKRANAGFPSMRNIIELVLPLLLSVLALCILLTSYRRSSPENGFLSLGRNKRQARLQARAGQTGPLLPRLRD